MAKPMTDLSDDELRAGIKNGDYEGRDALIAAEILKRRHEERARSGGYVFGKVGALVASVWLWLTIRLRLRKTD
jgi:hypothetical protein